MCFFFDIKVNFLFVLSLTEMIFLYSVSVGMSVVSLMISKAGYLLVAVRISHRLGPKQFC